MSSNDSRRAALKYYGRTGLAWVFNTSTFIGNLAIALIITYFFRQIGYGDAVDYVFLLTILAVGLWVTEAIPPFAVGIFIIAMLLFGFGTDFLIDESAPVELYVGTWTSNVVWLLMGGFFLALGMREVELDHYIFRQTVTRFGKSPERLLFGLMMTTALVSMIMSNTATSAMMISSILPVVHSLGRKSNYSRALLIGIPAAATVGGMGTIIGSTPNAIAVGALQERGVSISFVEWMIVGFPTGILLVWLFYKYLIRRLNLDEVKIDVSDLVEKRESGNIEPYKRRAVVVTFFITITLWLTEPLHGIPVAATAAVPIVLLTLTQVITADQVRSLPWETLMLVAGGLALGLALVDVGLADIVMSGIKTLPVPTLIVAVIFSLVAVVLSNVMSNTAAAAILIPLAITLPAPFNIALPLIVALSCSCALLLPVSTPPNAIAYATGLLEAKDFRPGGLFLIVIGPMAAFISVMIWTWLTG